MEPIPSLGRSISAPFLGNPDLHVRISDDVKRIVLFFGLPDTTPGLGGIRCFGTGFLVGHEGEGYLVTAKHLARPLQDTPFIIRLNRKDGTSENGYADNAHWCEHPDPNVDVAVIPLRIPKASIYDYIYLKSEVFASPEYLKQENIGPGDMTYTVGLFRLMSGERRSLPVVHSGTIALMPGDEKIPVKDWEDATQTKRKFVEGYLVETNAISGLSGSPVFVRSTVALEIEGKKMPDGHSWEGVFPRSRAYLLGLWQSSWDAPPDEVMAAEISHGNVRVPVGMGIVVPVSKILEVLELDVLKARRAKLKEAAYPAASLDGAVPKTRIERPEPPTKEENPDHREAFNRLLDAAVKGPKPE